MSSRNSFPNRGQRSRLLAGLIVVVILGGISVILGSWNAASVPVPTTSTPIVTVTTPAHPAVGYASFESSGLVDAQMTQGINDEVQLDLDQVSDPDPGTLYYAWLLPDRGKGLVQSMLLGRLTVDHAAIHFHYGGDQQHIDLLANTSRLLVTEEDAANPPHAPSLDQHRWRYYGEIPQPLNLADSMHNSSLLDHIRSLLSGTPSLSDNVNMMPMQGGLRSWFVLNSRNILEWASSARGGLGTPEAPSYLRIDLYRILDELDGSTLVQQDVPVWIPLYVDPQAAQVPLLEVEPGQIPASYLTQIGVQLAAIAQSADATPQQRLIASRVTNDLHLMADTLGRVREVVRHLILLSDAQLAQPGTLPLLDELVEQSNSVYAGVLNPATGEREGGALWIADQLQRLATFVVQPCTLCTM